MCFIDREAVGREEPLDLSGPDQQRGPPMDVAEELAVVYDLLARDYAEEVDGGDAGGACAMPEILLIRSALRYRWNHQVRLQFGEEKVVGERGFSLEREDTELEQRRESSGISSSTPIASGYPLLKVPLLGVQPSVGLAYTFRSPWPWR